MKVIKVIKKIQFKKNYGATGYSGTPDWQEFGPEIYCEFDQGSGGEFFAAKQRHSDLAALAKNRQIIPGLDSAMVAVVDGVTYQIIEVSGLQERNNQEVKLKLVK